MFNKTIENAISAIEQFLIFNNRYNNIVCKYYIDYVKHFTILKLILHIRQIIDLFLCTILVTSVTFITIITTKINLINNS